MLIGIYGRYTPKFTQDGIFFGNFALLYTTVMDPSILDFLADLNRNNDREWFQDNRERYREALQSFESFINLLIPAIREFDPVIDMVTAKDCLFRIYRDVRFSRNKLPYKTNFGAFIARGGKNSQMPGYYVHVEPGNSFLAGGIHMPTAEVLRQIRQEIFYNVEEYKKIIHDGGFRKYFNSMDDSGKLVKAPKDFPADFPDIDLIKYKTYTFSHDVDDDQLISPNYDRYTVRIFEILHPFINFFNKIFT